MTWWIAGILGFGVMATLAFIAGHRQGIEEERRRSRVRLQEHERKWMQLAHSLSAGHAPLTTTHQEQARWN